jgi:hypothetical protein
VVRSEPIIYFYFSSILEDGAASSLALSRAQLMNSSAKGLSVRFLTVMIETANRGVENRIGRIRTPLRSALNRATDIGSSPTKRLPSIKVTVSCPDKVTTAGRGGGKSWARKISWMSAPGTLS